MQGPIRWGILSTANIARKRFVPGVRASRNGEVTAIASRDAGRARAVARELAIPRAHGSYDALLADPDVDAVYIGLPNSMHATWTIAAAHAGKAVLCEKPLASNETDIARMIEACREADVPLMEAFMYRFHPQHARVVELIRSGTIGEVRALRTSFTFSMEPLPPDNVRLRSELDGGALMDVGCYTINAARWFFGEEPAWASAQAEVHPQYGVEIAAAGVLGFSDGRMATFDCGFRGYGLGSYQIAGTEGQIDVPAAFVPNPPDADTSIVVSDKRGRREQLVRGDDAYKLEAEAFADALLQHHDVPFPPEDAVKNARVLDALKRSAREGGPRQQIHDATV